jgi:hypothetical protein
MTGLFDTLAPGSLTPAQQKTKSAPKQPSYSAEDIEVLEGLEPVRRRPGMYIGGTDERSLHHLVSEVLDNAMDEAVAGYASDIHLTLHEDGSVSVKDNGRGIPVDPHPKFQDKSALEVILTTLHSGGKFSNKVYDTIKNLQLYTIESRIWHYYFSKLPIVGKLLALSIRELEISWELKEKIKQMKGVQVYG